MIAEGKVEKAIHFLKWQKSGKGGTRVIDPDDTTEPKPRPTVKVSRGAWARAYAAGKLAAPMMAPVA